MSGVNSGSTVAGNADSMEDTRTEQDVAYAAYEQWAAELIASAPAQALLKAARDDIKRHKNAGVNFRASRIELFREFRVNGNRGQIAIEDGTDGFSVKIWVLTDNLDLALYPDTGVEPRIKWVSYSPGYREYSAEPLVSHAEIRDRAGALILAASETLEPLIPPKVPESTFE